MPDQLHVVFGTGQVGKALATHLARLGIPVRSVSRHRPTALAEGIDWRAADAGDPEAASDAAKGASVVYQCLNAPYTEWPRVPATPAGGDDRSRADGAVLVTLGKPLRLRLDRGKGHDRGPPLAATTVKGRARAAMTQELLTAADAGRLRIAIGRASDFFGAGASPSPRSVNGSSETLWPGRRADFIGNPDLPHTYSYVPDIAAGLAILGTDTRALGQVWHLPGPETITTRAVLNLMAGRGGTSCHVRSVPKLVLRTLGVVKPMMRGLAEMAYEFEEPFVLDTTKYETTFRRTGTP